MVTVGNKRVKFCELVVQPVLDEKILEDIKLKCCFVTSFERSRQFYAELGAKKLNLLADSDAFTKVTDFKFAPDCDYPLSNNLILHIPGYVREMTLEALFVNHIDSNLTIPNLILDTLLKCPIDLKKDMASNVVLIGGNFMLSGFKHRLVSELDYLLNDDAQLYAKEFSFRKLKFHQPPAHDNYTAWLGASIFGTLEILDLYSIPRVAA
jgi:actin-related protein 10